MEIRAASLVARGVATRESVITTAFHLGDVTDECYEQDDGAIMTRIVKGFKAAVDELVPFQFLSFVCK